MVNVGDTFTGAVVGVARLQLRQLHARADPAADRRSPDGLHAGDRRAVRTANQLTVATFNVENLDPGDGPAKFDALAALIVNNLQRAGHRRARGDPGQQRRRPTTASSTPSVTLAQLIAAIHGAGGPTYQYRQINPVNDQDGGEPGGNIRVGFLFRTDRGLSFVDRAGRRLDRPPIGVADAGATGRSCPSARAASTRPTPPSTPAASRWPASSSSTATSCSSSPTTSTRRAATTRCSAASSRRRAQLGDPAPPAGAVVHDFVARSWRLTPNANIVVLGDLNDFDFSETLTILEGARRPERPDRDAAGQRALHLRVRGQLAGARPHPGQQPPRAATAPDYDVVHVNAEFADQASDHDPQVTRFTLPSFDSVRALVHLYSTSSTVTDSLVADLTTAETQRRADQDAALADFHQPSTRRSVTRLTWNQADILLQVDQLPVGLAVTSSVIVARR